MTSKFFRTALPVAAVLVVAGIGGGAWLYLNGSFGESQPGGIGGPFTLTNGAGQTVTDRDLRGRYLLVYFGYTFCPDVCPTTLNDVAAALEILGPKADRVQPLFITVDPARDTPNVVGEYTAAFSPRILGLSGTPEQIAAVAREYRVYFMLNKPAKPGGDYTVDHSSILYLMDTSGRFIAPVRADQPPAQMAAEIARHLT